MKITIGARTYLRGAERFLATIIIFSLVLLPTGPAFAQLGDVTPPPVEALPAPVVTPTPPPAEVTPPPTEPVVQIVTPPADTSGPAISGVANLSLATHDATIVWTTDELAVSTFEYGTTESYGGSATLPATLLLAHTAILVGLTPGTIYHYCIHTTDLAGNPANSCGHTFTTASQTVIIDTTPPDVSLITVAPITTTGATVNFTTTEVGNARVEYGTTAGYGDTTTLDTNLGLTHRVTLSNLTPSTIYHYRIITSDEIGNGTITSDETFTTEATTIQIQSQGQIQVSGVTISEIETVSISTSAVTITWQTNLPSDSQIEYGDSENFGLASVLSQTLTTSHSVILTGLTPNTNYVFRVKSKPVGVSIATVSGSNEFNTLNHSIPVVAPANIISVSSSGITSTGATITWSTDKTATSQVEYGISTGYGVLSNENATLATSHSISLTDLEPSTTYHFRVKSIDEVSNITFSEDYTFTTSAAPSGSSNVGGTSVPAAIATLVIGGYDNTSTELLWHVGSASTDIAALYDVRYSTSPINASNFGQAGEAQLVPIYYGDISPNGTERAYIVAGLNSNTTYYFAIKSKHESSQYSPISNVVSVTTTSGASINTQSVTLSSSPSGPSGSIEGSSSVTAQYGSGSSGTGKGSFEPTMVKAEPADGQIIFQWNNPGEENFVRTVVVRKEGSYPSTPADGQTLYEGRGNTYTDTEVQNGKTYYYAVYSYNHSKTYSKGVNISLAPNGGNKQIKFNESGTLASSTPAFHFVRTWKFGDKDIEIEHLQEILVADQDSYPEKYVTGYFGSLTQAALKRFQTKHGLPQTGVVDTATQQKLNTVSHSETKLNIPMDVIVFETDLKRGDEGEAVKDLQQYLIYEGSYVEAIVSGYFGNYTYNAVKIFQAKYGITPVSGYVAYKTRHKMQQLVGL